jgi:O-6-methylguanine DNA methyltransferase
MQMIETTSETPTTAWTTCESPLGTLTLEGARTGDVLHRVHFSTEPHTLAGEARIPYGETTTYGAIARELGVPADGHDPPARIVGAAIGRTPIPIVIPCHRVLAADGALRGYRGGLETKRALLDFEATGGLRAALAEGWERDQLSLL